MNDFDIWFSTVRTSIKNKLILLKAFKSTEGIWQYAINEETYFQNETNEQKLKRILRSSWDKYKIDRIKSIMLEKNIKLITYYNKLYPDKLRNFDDAPAVIFYKGNIENLNKNKSISIVGSRKYTYYGENIANILGKEFAKNNINVISGMAKGIDFFSHNACIKEKGYTCAVLGCGVDVIYPLVNKKLYHEIIQNEGVIMSEFVPETKPYAYNFPLRNRIISGLSDLLIVVEASQKSGSLITASYALDQGVDVMAVPGSIFSKTSIGTNKLIKDGAYPLTSVKDVFNILNIEYNKINEPKLKFSSSLEEGIYKLIKDKPIHIDDIIRIMKVDTKILYEVLFELQLKNQITCLSGNYYVRIANSV